MSSHRDPRKTSTAILICAAGLAAGFWGFYLWRATREPAPVAPVNLLADAGKPVAVEATTLTAKRPPAIHEIIEKVKSEQSPAETEPGTREAATMDTEPSTVRVNAAPAGEVQPVEEIQIATPEPEKPKLIAPEPRKTEPTTLLVSGREALSKGDMVGARAAWSAAIARGLPPREDETIRAELVRMADNLIFSMATGTGDPLTTSETIGAGDTLHTIAGRYRITDGMLARINGITEPNRLRLGQRVKVIRGPFRAVISKSGHRMDIYLGDIFVRSFRVGLGTNGGTPTGTWVVNSKLENPDWTDPRTNQYYSPDDPQNPIGERWIGLNGTAGEAIGKIGFGIHGTIDPESIGANMSMGCIRLAPDDVIQVYDLLVMQSEIVIQP